MIEYINPNRAFTGEAYDETYRHDPDRFGHGITFRALNEVFRRYLRANKPQRIFDLGCGQGVVLSWLRSDLMQGPSRSWEKSDYYGIDISEVAIQQCESHDPDIHWIVDSFQDFLSRSDTKERFGRFDLIINKGGLTAVHSAEEYRAMLDGVRNLLREDGIYLFVQYKQFYQVWSNEHCAEWDTDIFELAEQVFGPAERIADESAYICIHKKQSVIPRQTEAAIPRRICFRMNDGSEQRVFVSGDELTPVRLERVRAISNDQRPLTLGAIDTKRDLERQERAPDDFQPGRPSALLATGRVRMTDARTIDPSDHLYQALRARFNVASLPGMTATTRHLCKSAPEISLARPSAIVIGPGLEDFKRPMEPALPLVDPDEFRYRLDWALELFVREAKATVVYIATPPVVDFMEDRNGFLYRRADGLEFSRIAGEVCAEHGVQFEDVSKCIKPGDSRPRQSQMIAERAAQLLNVPEHVICTR